MEDIDLGDRRGLINLVYGENPSTATTTAAGGGGGEIKWVASIEPFSYDNDVSLGSRPHDIIRTYRMRTKKFPCEIDTDKLDI